MKSLNVCGYVLSENVEHDSDGSIWKLQREHDGE